MAFLKCLKKEPVPPAPQIPINTTFTNEYNSYHDTGVTVNKQEVFSTRNVASIKVKVDWWIGAYASIDDSRRARNISRCYFYVNGVQYLDTGTINVQSNNDGWVTRSGSTTYTITNLPNGDCTFDYNIYSQQMWMTNFSYNGGGTGYKTYVRFTVTEVNYQ